MTEADLPLLTSRLLWAAFALGLGFGAVSRLSHFCTMGAVADLVSMGDSTRLRLWALAAGVAVLGFNGAVAAGWVKAADTLYAAPQLLWLSHLVGGLMFGFGMVLASGCGGRALVRLGGGNLKALVVFLVLALAALATLRGLTGLARVQWLDAVRVVLPTGQDLPSLLGGLGGSAAQRALALAGLIGGGLVLWALATPRRAEVLPGGLAIGALVLALWAVSAIWGHLPEHPLTLEEAWLATNSGKAESFSFVAPLAYAVDGVLWASDTGRRITMGMVLVPGVVLGSAAVALATRSFRWEGFASAEDTALHLIGATLMGVGGVCALGCSIGQGLTGLSTLALGSVITLAAVLAGATLALRWQLWRLERSA